MDRKTFVSKISTISRNLAEGLKMAEYRLGDMSRFFNSDLLFLVTTLNKNIDFCFTRGCCTCRDISYKWFRRNFESLIYLENLMGCEREEASFLIIAAMASVKALA